VTRRGQLAGVFVPLRGQTLPVELNQALLAMLTTEIARQIKRRDGGERQTLADFERWREGRRCQTRRRR
jgi:hypothetical protein